MKALIGSWVRLLSFLFKRRKRKTTAANTTSMRPPRTHPRMIPNSARDDKEWDCADPVVLLVVAILPVEEADTDVLSGISILG